MPRRRVSSFSVCAVFGLGALAGCSSDPPTPKPLSTPSVSPSQSPSTSVSAAPPPTLPAAARGHSDASARAFVDHYFRLVNFATETGDTAPLDAVSDSRCESCTGISRLVHGIYLRGGSIRSHGWKVVKAGRPVATSGGRAINLVVLESPERITQRAAAAVKDNPGGRQQMAIYLQRARGAWSVRRLDLVQ